MVTVGEPGTQGPGVFGMQGIGVRTPSAADVAEATVGFAREMHIPNGRIFTKGALSMMLASGVPVFTRWIGNTTKLLDASPNVH